LIRAKIAWVDRSQNGVMITSTNEQQGVQHPAHKATGSSTKGHLGKPTTPLRGREYDNIDRVKQ
jgi:hypothetical protein